MDINYHVFFALAAMIFNATWRKHCGKVQKDTFKVQKYIFKLQKHTFKVQKYTFEVQKYTFKVQKYTFKVHTYTYLQLTKCLRARNLLNPEPWNCKTCWNPLKPGGPGSQNWFPGTAKPVTQNRFAEPGSFPERPQLDQNTLKSILCKDSIAFCCWGKICYLILLLGEISGSSQQTWNPRRGQKFFNGFEGHGMTCSCTFSKRSKSDNNT